MRYTKQAMPLERQMDTLKQRGLIIDDEAAAQQALDTISYFRLADYWFHLEADHRSHAFLPDSHFDEVLSCYHFDKDLKMLLLRYPNIDTAAMGFPANWRQEPLWQS